MLDRKTTEALAQTLTGIGIAAWLVGIVSWFPLASIETAALSQPDHAAGEFTQPMHLKGVVRYVTPEQQRRDNLAHMGFAGGWILGATGLLTGRWLKNRA